MELSPGIAGYRISNPPALLCAPLEASLKVLTPCLASGINSHNQKPADDNDVILFGLSTKKTEHSLNVPFSDLQ